MLLAPSVPRSNSVAAPWSDLENTMAVTAARKARWSRPFPTYRSEAEQCGRPPATVTLGLTDGCHVAHWFPSPSLGAPLLSESRSPPLCWGMALCWLGWRCAWTGRCLVIWRALAVAGGVVAANIIGTSSPPRTGTAKVRIFERNMGLSFRLAVFKRAVQPRPPRAAFVLCSCALRQRTRPRADPSQIYDNPS